MDFAEAVASASAEAEMEAGRALFEARYTDWRAAAEFLRRRFPDRWGDRQRVEVSDGPVRFMRALDPSDPETEHLLDELRHKVAGSDRQAICWDEVEQRMTEQRDRRMGTGPFS